MRAVLGRGRWPLVLLAGLSMTLAACSTTIGGRGTYAGGASATAGSATPSAGGPADFPGRRSLHCSGRQVISPAGSPYCYLIPAGFTDVSKSVTVDTTVGSEKYRSAVAVGDRDLIIVTVYELLLDIDPIGDRELETQLATVLKQLAAQGFAFDSTTPKKSTVDGARAFSYHAREPKNRLEANVYFLFRAKTEVEVNCQWQQKPADVQRGCRQLLGSLQIKTVT